MIRSNLFAVLALAIGCSDHPVYELPLDGGDTSIHDLDTAFTEDTAVDTDTDEDTAPSVDTYDGARAVLEGAMSSSGIQYAVPGNTVEMGYWTFSVESLDGAEHTATVAPTSFAFTIDSDNDYRFGIPLADAVVAGDVIHFCWFVQEESSGAITVVGEPDVGGPELNTMANAGLYPTFEVGADAIAIGLWCTTHDDAPIGTKIAVSMDYEVTGDDVFDASTARLDNTGILPQYYVRID